MSSTDHLVTGQHRLAPATVPRIADLKAAMLATQGALSERNPRTVADVAARAGLTRNMASYMLDLLKRDDLVVESERGFRFTR